MRKLELIIAIIMLLCTAGSLIGLFFCNNDTQMMMTTLAFIISAAVGVLAVSGYSTSES